MWTVHDSTMAHHRQPLINICTINMRMDAIRSRSAGNSFAIPTGLHSCIRHGPVPAGQGPARTVANKSKDVANIANTSAISSQS